MRRYPLDADLAATVRRRRTRVGFSQNDLALASGLTEASVARYETLRCGISPQALARIEGALAKAERQAAVPA
jgi:transcriptional regulator with XRE-family HTH domain